MPRNADLIKRLLIKLIWYKNACVGYKYAFWCLMKLQQCTTPFKDYLLKDLAQPEFAKGYFETALQNFDKDGNIEILLLAMEDIAEAQGGIEALVAWTHLSPQALIYLLNAEHPLQLDKVLDILSTLKDSLMVSEQSNKKEQEHGSC